MFHSDRKPFEGKKKSPWNKGISEKNNKKTKKIKKQQQIIFYKKKIKKYFIHKEKKF